MRRPRIPLAPARLRWGAVVAVAAAICYASVLVDPGGAGPGVLGPYWDKILHAGAYAFLALVTAYATVNWRRTPSRRALAVFAGTAGYGLLIEVAQATVPYRQFSPADAAANAAGALFVFAWVAVETRVRYRRIVRGDDPLPRREE